MSADETREAAASAHSAEQGHIEHVGYALQVQVNPGRPSAYWRMDPVADEIRDTVEEAWADFDHAEEDGFQPSDLRVVALTVVTRPEPSGGDA